MSDFPYRTALMVGAGPGIGASVTRALVAAGVKVAVAARRVDRLDALARETGASTFAADASDPGAAARLFEAADARLGMPDVVLCNAGGRVRGPLVDLDPEAVRQALDVSAFGAFLVVQQAAKRMPPARRGAILLTGATAGIKGFAQSSAFAMGKFALRGLARSAARELGPQGIHVAHVVIDGGIRSASRPTSGDSMLDPDAIARTCLDLLRQHRSAWSMEVDLRPWTERF